MTQVAINLAGTPLPLRYRRCAHVFALVTVIAIAGCSEPDALSVRCQKQIVEQFAGSGSLVKHSSSHTVLPGTPDQKIRVLKGLVSKITDKRYKQLIEFHIPQVKKLGDNAGISNIKIEFDFKFAAGGVQPRVGNCYYFWSKVGASEPKTLAIIVTRRRTGS